MHRISNKGTARLSNNPLIERLTRTHFMVPVILFMLMGACFIGYGASIQSLPVTFLLSAGGIFFFTFIEYMLHRFVFHFSPHTPTQEELKYKIHGVHHHFPKDKDRLAMPTILSISISGLFLCLFYISMGAVGYTFFGGFCLGYALYLIIHYSVHCFRQPRNFLSFLWKHHSLHHYYSDKAAFGVSNPLWDYIFGTMPVKERMSR